MALFHYGSSRPPRTRRRRRSYAVSVLLLCALLGPFVVVGAVRGWTDLDDLAGTLAVTVLAVICLTGAVIAARVLVESYRRPGPEAGARES